MSQSSTLVRSKSAPRLPLICAVLTAGLGIGALILYTLCGASPLGAMFTWAVAFLAVYGPGSALREQLCPDVPSGLGPVLDLIFGGAVFSLSALLASWTGLHFLVWISTGLGWCVWAVQHRKGAHRPAPSAEPDYWILAVIAAGYVFCNALWATRYIHPSVATVAAPSQDFFWNLGNTQSLLQGFPMADLRVEGVTVSYHFLTELIGAGLCMLTGLPAYDVVAFYAYAPVAVAMVLCLYGLGRCLWGENASLRSLLLASLPLWLGCASLWKVMGNGLGRFGNVLSIYSISNINGQATAFLALAAFFAVFAVLEQSSWNAPAGVWAAAIAGFYLLVFSKSPQAAILALALLCAFAVRAVVGLREKHRTSRAMLVFLALVPLGFWVVYLLFFSAGADSSMSFSLTGTLNLYFFASILQALRIRFAGFWQVFLPVLWLAQSLLAAPAAFCVWVVSAVRDLFHLNKVSALHLTWHACIVGGIAAFFWFDHYSSSQLYFFVLAIFCMGLVLLDRLPALWQACSDARGPVVRVLGRAAQGVCVLLLAVSCATGVFTLTWLARTAPVQLAGGAADERYFALTAEEEQACTWLAENMEADALFGTNRMHTGRALEGLSNVYTGLSGRQAYCESFKYAVSNMGKNAGDVMTRYDQMCRIFSPETDEAELRQLCSDTGIDYLLYHKASPGSDTQLACLEKVYDAETISIYKVS